MKLSEAKKNTTYTIRAVHNPSELFYSKASQLGLRVGHKVELKHLAPIFKDPMLFMLEDSLVALTRHEASCIEIQEDV